MEAAGQHGGSGAVTAGRPLGLWMCVALVVGNMIGSGIFLLPAALAPFGWNAVLGWVVTIAGALCLAFVLARLAGAFPRAGGPYAYTREAFGAGAGFLVAWSYWISIVVGNAAVATGSISYLSALFPVIGATSGLAPAVAVGIIWILTAINIAGARSAGAFTTLLTLVKLLPLAAIVILAGLVVARTGGATLMPLHAQDIHLSGIVAASTLALWGLLGLESATVPADKVVDPARTIPRATMIGTAFTGGIYLIVCSGVLLLMPAAQLARSQAPFADFMARYWGGHAGTVLAGFAALSGIGALNGWVLLQGELPCAMARGGVFPAWLGKTSAGGTPVRAHLLSTGLLTIVVMMNYQRSMIDLFTFIVLLSTNASLFAYLFSALAGLKLNRRIGGSPLLAVVAVLAAAYSAFAIYGAGREAGLWGLVFLASGVPVFLLMQAGLRRRAKTEQLA